MHRPIKGVRPDGEPYHALEPRAYAWVHATLASALVDGQRVFGTALTREESEAFWRDWLRLGRLIGVRERDLPATWAGFGGWFDAMVDDELQDDPTVHLVLETLARPAPPEIPGLPPRLWRIIRTPLAGQLRLATVGMLPGRLRERLGLRWTAADGAAFRAFAAASRASTPFVRGPLREFGPYYVRWRRAALERGDVARAAPARFARDAAAGAAR
jgi:uncharacterized protein (DUF2236 family)